MPIGTNTLRPIINKVNTELFHSSGREWQLHGQNFRAAGNFRKRQNTLEKSLFEDTVALQGRGGQHAE